MFVNSKQIKSQLFTDKNKNAVGYRSLESICYCPELNLKVRRKMFMLQCIFRYWFIMIQFTNGYIFKFCLIAIHFKFDLIPLSKNLPMLAVRVDLRSK